MTSWRPPGGQTLLGADLTPEQVEASRREDETKEKVRVLVFDIWLQAYRDGEASLEVMLTQARKLLNKLGDQRLLERALGSMVNLALSSDPPKRSRGNKGQPKVIRKLAVGLVDLVVAHEGLRKSRGGKELTAFERASQILVEAGVATDPRQIEDWYYHPK
ncbi:MAG: hypothetical protein Q8L16_26955 [Hydrogenophaga sp.]|nr:hypothetical protein [Hydrogenophaga sp.]